MQPITLDLARVRVAPIRLRNEADLLNPLIDLLARLGFTIIAEPRTLEGGRVLAPDLLAFKRVTRNQLLLLLFEAKMQVTGDTSQQLTKYTKMLPEFNHILLVPAREETAAQRIVRNLRRTCLIVLREPGTLELQDCTLHTTTATLEDKTSTLAKLATYYAANIHHGPDTGNPTKLSKAITQTPPSYRAKKLRRLISLIRKLPQTQSDRILRTLELLIRTLQGNSTTSLAQLLQKPYTSILLHYINNLSTAQIRDRHGFKQPTQYHICY